MSSGTSSDAVATGPVDFELRPGEDIFLSADEATLNEAWHFRQVLGRFPTGVTVVTSMHGDEPVGMTCQSFTSVSLSPPLILFCPAKTSRTWPRIAERGSFAINFLSGASREVSDVMATKGADKFAGVDWRPSEVTGSPLLLNAGAFVDCQVDTVHDGGDHHVVIGRVVSLGALQSPPGDPTDPLLFFDGSYRRLADD